MADWHGPLIPEEVLDHRGKWVAIDSHVQPPRLLFVHNTHDEVMDALRVTGTRALVMRVPTEDEPELVGAG